MIFKNVEVYQLKENQIKEIKLKVIKYLPTPALKIQLFTRENTTDLRQTCNEQ
jgi:hypothetical protein